MRRKKKYRKSSWQRFGPVPRWQIGLVFGFVALLLYALLKVVATGQGFFGLWLSSFLNAVEGVFTYLSKTILSPIGLILITLGWLVKTGDFYRLLNKIRYMRFTKGEQPVVHFPKPTRGATKSVPLNAWQRSLLSNIERTDDSDDQKRKWAQLVIYEQLSEKQAVLPLLQFLHHYRREDISFFQVAQFLTAEGLINRDRLSRQELDIEAEVLGYMGYLQHAGLIEAHITLQPAPDGFYGTIHKVKIPQRVREVMALFIE